MIYFGLQLEIGYQIYLWAPDSAQSHGTWYMNSISKETSWSVGIKIKDLRICTYMSNQSFCFVLDTFDVMSSLNLPNRLLLLEPFSTVVGKRISDIIEVGIEAYVRENI